MTKEKFPTRYVPYYLVDPVRGDYEEFNMKGMKKRLNRSDNFIYDRCNDGELFIIDGRAYYLTSNFAKVWDLI